MFMLLSPWPRVISECSRPSSEMWDVIVVGAGPAGSTSAYLLAKSGLSVLLLDKREFPRPKPCGGGITMKAAELLERIGIDWGPVEKIHREVEVRGFGEEIVVEAPPGEFAVATVRRELFDKTLLDHALSEGAEFRRALVRHVDLDGGVVVDANGDRLKAKYIIGADGAASTVASASGLRCCLGREDLILAIEGKGPKLDRLTFFMDAAPMGYGWIFPLKEGSNAGVGGLATHSQEITRSFERFASAHDVRKVGSWIIPVGGHSRPIGRGRVLLIGDAAGLADPLTGEGIYFALVSAQKAAETVLEGGTGEDYQRKMKDLLDDLRARRRAAKILVPKMELFFKLLVAYPEIAKRFTLAAIGKLDFRKFLRWSFSVVPLAYIKMKLRR